MEDNKLNETVNIEVFMKMISFKRNEQGRWNDEGECITIAELRPNKWTIIHHKDSEPLIGEIQKPTTVKEALDSLQYIFNEHWGDLEKNEMFRYYQLDLKKSKI